MCYKVSSELQLLIAITLCIWCAWNVNFVANSEVLFTFFPNELPQRCEERITYNCFEPATLVPTTAIPIPRVNKIKNDNNFFFFFIFLPFFLPSQITACFIYSVQRAIFPPFLERAYPSPSCWLLTSASLTIRSLSVFPICSLYSNLPLTVQSPMLFTQHDQIIFSFSAVRLIFVSILLNASISPCLYRIC